MGGSGKRYPTELCELTLEERSQLTGEIAAVGRALARALGTVTVNDGLLGNQLAWSVRHAPRHLSLDERRARIAAIRSHLPS